MSSLRAVWIGCLVAALLQCELNLEAVPPPTGVAPVLVPSGGFAIDGNLAANTPTSGAGDWMPGPGSGGAVLDATGAPINPSTTFHFTDLYNDTGDNTFAGGLKWTDNPTSWQWTASKASSKTDINNALMHIATDANGHFWVVIAADRFSNSGDSYIDFEFLQNTLTLNANGTFSSAGPNGGRTLNDVLLSLNFSSGGSVPDFTAWRWLTNTASGGFTYADATSALTAGQVFGAASPINTPVPFGAFGGNIYGANQFVEAAVDLTALLGNIDPCLSIGFATLMIKTKTSTSSTASISDFINPIQITLRIGPSAYAGPNQTNCTQGTSTAFSLQGQATQGMQPIASTTWSVVSGSATIDSPGSLNTTAHVSSSSATLRLTAIQSNGCTETSDVILAVASIPTSSISGASTVCPLSSSQFSAPAGLASYGWSISGNGSIVGATNAQTVTVKAGASCGASFTLSLNVANNNGCTNSSNTDVLVQDTVAPVITSIPANVTVSCAGAVPAANDAAVVASDNCNGAVTIGHSDQTIAGGCANNFVIKRTYTATDSCGNSSSQVQTITVSDTTAPVITSIPGDVTVSCAGAVPAANDGAVVATDNCGGSPVISHTDQTIAGACNNKFVIKRTYTATDACGLSSSRVQTITVNDTTAPVITSIPGDVTVKCAGAVPAANDGAVLATDNCGGSPVVSHSDQTISGACANKYVIKRTYTATDSCGNSSSQVQTITVNDDTAPVITGIPGDVTVQCAAAVPAANDGSVVATDNCGATPVITHSDQTIAGACVNKFVIKRTYTATDVCGNSSSQVQTITVNDNTAPVITSIPGDVTVQCAGSVPTANDAAVAATDSCGGTPVITHSDQTIAGSCANKFVIKRTYTATDACGNSSSQIQTITVNDNTGPVITSIPGDVTLACAGSVPAANDGAVVATDNCGGTPVISHADQTIAGSCANKFVIKRTYTATDSCGNSSSRIQTITINDTTAPVLTIPWNLTLECPADTSTNNTGVATAVDNCGPSTVSYSDIISNNCGGGKIIGRVWTAVDPCGNTSSAIQTITVRDTVPPTITAPPNLVLECPANTTTNSTGVAVAQDGCGSVTIRYSDNVSNSCGNTKVITRTWTASDGCGNGASAIQTITLRDTTAPAFRLPADVVQQCPGDTRTNVTGVPFAQDSCGSVLLTYSDVVSNSCGLTKTVWRTWTATDQCGNTTNGVQTISVIDTTKPTITCPNISVQCAGDVPAPYADLSAFLAAGGKATDTCSSSLAFTLMSDSGLSGSCPAKLTRVYRLTDACGNFADGTQTITVDDTIAPVLTCPAALVLECGASLDPTNTGLATATDNCDTNVTVTHTDALVQAQYNLQFLVADPDTGTGPYSPTYLKFGPDSLPCPDEARLTGRALDPLRNAVAFAPSGQLDALTSIGNVPMVLGQIVPFETVIQVSGGSGPEHGTIEFTADWDTYTTSNNRFGYDTNYMVYCAFVDAADPGSIDPNNNARVESFSSTIVNPGTISEAIRGTFRVSGLDSGDRVVVEIWVVLDSTMPDHTGGTVAAGLVSAQTAANPPVPITIGVQTDSLGNLSKIGIMPPPQQQPPLGPLPPQPPVLPGATTSVINRTWTATDACGNNSSCVQQITVRDTTPPALNLPADVVLECPADTSTNNTGVATASDLCASFSLSFSDVVSNGCGNTKMVSRLWTATDSNGNTTNRVQTITVRDTTPPVVTAPANKTIECTASLNPSVNTSLGRATAVDGCSGASTPTYSDQIVPGNCAGNYTVKRTWSSLDACGNVGTALQSITVQDTAAPTITAPASVVLPFTADISPSKTGTATATDSCSGVSLAYRDSLAIQANGAQLISRTWTATDGCGNSASALQTITLSAPSALILPNQNNIVLTDLTTVTVNNTASNPNVPANPISYQLLNPPAGATIDGNGIISWTPTLGQSPSTNVITTVATTTVTSAAGSSTISSTNSFLVIITSPYDGLDMGVDTDGDGLTNLVEFAVGSDPKDSADASSGIEVWITEDSGNRYLAMRFNRRVNAAALQLQYLPEVSADKTTWSGDNANVLQLSVTPLNSEFESVIVRDQTVITPAAARFIRLHIISANLESASPTWIGTATTVQGNSGTGVKFTTFSQRMVLPVVYAGTVSSLQNSALTDTNAAWAPGQFAGVGSPAYAEFDNGWMVDIAGTTGTSKSLSLAGSLTGLVAPGDAYRVRQHFTIASVFGTNNEAGLKVGLNPASADNIMLVIPQTQQTVTVFYFSNAVAHGWYRADFTPAADQVVYPEQGVMVRRIVPGNVNVYLCGPIKTGPTIAPVEPGFNLVGTLKSLSPMTLNGLNLYTGNPATGISSGLNLAASDNVLVVQPNGATASYFYFKDSRGHEGWLDATFSPAGNIPVPAGSAFFIHRQLNNSAFDWTIPAE